MFYTNKVLMKLLLLLLACLLAAASSCAAEDLSPKEDFLTVGNIVTFGHYEQDNDVSNGAEPIEWIVLDVQDGKALLLSRYGLDSRPYHSEFMDITWEACALRSWLNGNFMNAAFTQEEQSAILLTDVDNGADQGFGEWNTVGGENTRDKVFLLSYAEANRYLGVSTEDRERPGTQVEPSAYALSRGISVWDEYRTESGAAPGWWWLRSPGYTQDHAAYVNFDGAPYYNYVSNEYGLDRPALWLNLESDIF